MNIVELNRVDITKLTIDAIVNAANTSLLGGGGVDGAIHRAAGPELLTECRRLNGCATGQAKITTAYQLPANYIIHAVGPVWCGGQHNEANLLASCYRECLTLTTQYKIKSIAFPAISCRIYRFPADLAANIVRQEIEIFLACEPMLDKIVLSCFNSDVFNAYDKIFK